MDNCEKFDDTTIQRGFYSKLILKGIGDENYAHAQKIWEVFGIKNCGEYYDFQAKSDTLLLADVFENFRNMCLKIYELDPTYFVSAPGLHGKPAQKRQE